MPSVFVILLFVSIVVLSRGLNTYLIKTKSPFSFSDCRAKAIIKPDDSSICKMTVSQKGSNFSNRIKKFSISNTKTRDIGVIESLSFIFELIINTVSGMLRTMGLQHGYGSAIVIVTILVRVLLIPLSIKQMESENVTAHIIKRLEEKINQKYARNEKKKTELLDELFLVTKNITSSENSAITSVIPSLVQIPVFLVLNQAVKNLLNERKLSESFLWIPSLDGSMFDKSRETDSLQWLGSILHEGKPQFGWKQTISYLILPLLIGAVKFSSAIVNLNRNSKDFENPENQLFYRFGAILSIFPPLYLTISYLKQPAVMSLFWLINSFAASAITLFIRYGYIFDLPILSVPPEIRRIKQFVENDNADL